MVRPIGIFTGKHDPHASRVEAALCRRALPFVRFDRDPFPSRGSLTAILDRKEAQWRTSLQSRNQPSFHFEDLQSIWYRRPSSSFRFHDMLSPENRAFAEGEARKGFDGVLRSTNCFWVSHPDALQAVEWKPRQLVVARQCGMNVPKTCITNSPEDALSFVEACGGSVIYKALRHGNVSKYGPALRQNQPVQTIYATVQTLSHVKEYARSIVHTATMFQEIIPKICDIRVTLFGDRVFATEIHAHHVERARVDWRKGYGDISYATHTLPGEIEQACLKMLNVFALAFSAIDMVLTPSGEYIFLEQNGNGQWLWLEDETGQPMTDALIDLLAGVKFHGN
jgi:glutathione synthase/RimK-type ligase-like ATP-grasp enzyme